MGELPPPLDPTGERSTGPNQITVEQQNLQYSKKCNHPPTLILRSRLSSQPSTTPTSCSSPRGSVSTFSKLPVDHRGDVDDQTRGRHHHADIAPRLPRGGTGEMILVARRAAPEVGDPRPSGKTKNSPRNDLDRLPDMREKPTDREGSKAATIAPELNATLALPTGATKTTPAVPCPTAS